VLDGYRDSDRGSRRRQISFRESNRRAIEFTNHTSQVLTRAVNEYIRGNFGHIRIRTDISADTRIEVT
jgi:hypothetical protein